MSHYPQVEYKKYSFLAVLAMGLAAIGIGFIVSCTVMIIYGINTLGDEPEELFSLIGNAARWIPAVRESVSPVFSSNLDDRRRPDYCSQLEITARANPRQDSDGSWRTVVTVVNNGMEIVSLLSLRVAVLDSKGSIIAESSEFAATPLAADPYWRGPLKPGSTRQVDCLVSGASSVASIDSTTTEVEVADIRIWDGAGQIWPFDSEVCKGVK